jgi:multiple sugar transport system ATP-binding protein
MSELSVNNLYLDYGSGASANQILKGVSMELQRGEVVALLGPSGSGKTTLLRAVAGLESPKSGAIRIGERSIYDGERDLEVPAEERNLGLVFQSYALWPHKTVFDNVAYGLKLRKMSSSDIAERVKKVLPQLGLGHLGERFPHQLSGGQQQRVAIARALVYNPPVILLDEPLSNLDAKLRLSMRVELARLHRQLGTTTIYVTHDQVEAMTLGERIVVLDGGRIQQIDTPMNLYQRPANLFVAGFLGSPAMNLLRGRLQRENGWQLILPNAALPLGALPAQSTDIETWNGREIVLGVRPEDLQPAEPHAAALEAQVEVIEPVGNEVFLNLRFGDQRIVSRVSPQQMPASSGSLHLGFHSDRLHFFAAENGARIA